MHALIPRPLFAAVLAFALAAPAAAASPLEPQRSVGPGFIRPSLHCFGALSPTVILDVSGETASLWTRVVPLLKERSRVCVWNQGAPVGPAQDAEALDAALAAAGETPPYVRVVHGRGTARAAAWASPSLAGIAFVDAAPLPAGAVLPVDLPVAVVSSTSPGDADWQDAQGRLAAASARSLHLPVPAPRGALPQHAPEAVAEGLDWLLRLVRLDAEAADYPAGD